MRSTAKKWVHFVVFLRPFVANLIMAAAVAALCAPRQACGTVVLNQRELSGHQGIEEGLGWWLRVDPAEVARQSSLGGMSALPILAGEDEGQREQETQNLFCTLRGEHMAPAAGMSPSPISPLSQAGGSGSGFAVSTSVLIPAPIAIQTSLPREPRAVLPTGPPWHWFRPPKTNQFGFC